MNKCCKCKLCKSYEDAIQMGECPIKKDTKSINDKINYKYYSQSAVQNEINRLQEKQINALDRKINAVRDELGGTINDLDFKIMGMFVLSIIFTTVVTLIVSV